MRLLLITLTAGTAVLLLSGCPDIPGSTVPGHSESHWKAAHTTHAQREEATTGPSQGHAAHEAGSHHKVSEIAWFQGTLDEAFSHRGCSESSPRRTLFRF
jgi:hypothetical protein